eukprot:comp18746_c2_seq1/m.20564 comp18746_c2_seq1/g.20564  ORF comp18746_c2_seq1/g.20564 comp18746_c2_seq1/m.20564 type:complete len:142 (-) comp18746_c2_seq1:21-446(-)
MATEVAQVYAALYSGQLDTLLAKNDATLRLFLPHLVSLSLAAQQHDGLQPVSHRTSVLQQITGRFPESDLLHEAFRVNYDLVRGFALQELHKKIKLDNPAQRSVGASRESSFAASLGDALGMEFESGSIDFRVRLVVREVP